MSTFPRPSRQPREPITLELVEQAILHLMQSGMPASEPHVRAILGGSPNVLHKLIGQWFRERAPALLAGKISLVQSDDLPRAVHDLVAELRAEARQALESAFAERLEKAEAREAEAAKAIAEARERDENLRRRQEELNALLPTLRADLDLSRAEAAAARAAAEAASQARREAEAAAEDARSLADEKKREIERLQMQLASANAEIDGLNSSLAAARQAEGAALAEIGRKEAEIRRITQESAATAASLRSSIDEIKAAHLREIQALRATQAEAAARWAVEKKESKAKIAELAETVETLKQTIARSQTAMDSLRSERDILKARLDDAERDAFAKADLSTRLREIMGRLESIAGQERGTPP